MTINTTIGSVLINEQLPEDLRDYSRVYNKKELSNLITNIGKKYPQQYAKLVKKVKDLGDEHSYLQGSSFSFNDIAPRDISDINKKYQPLLNKARKISDPYARDEAFRSINLKKEEEINKKVSEDIKNNINRFYTWGHTGARGNAMNFRQLMYSSGNQVDVTNNLSPHMAEKSFSEGLSPSDFFISSKGARRGVVLSFTQVQEPGAFAKEMNALNNDMVVSMVDCNTNSGRTYPVLSPDALDRTLLKNQGSYLRNTVVTQRIQEDLKKKGFSSIEVRTPFGCVARDGICSMCSGLKENGELPHVGEAIGSKMGQAVTEPQTQMVLGSKHRGGVVENRTAFDIIKQLFHVPEQFPGGAVLARESGKVTKFEKTPAGDMKVYVNNTGHILSPSHKLLVKKGQSVKAGDALSDGLINPSEVTELKGMDSGREYLSEKLRSIYAENGKDGHPKGFEIVVRSVMNLGKVEDPGDHDFDYDEIVRWNQNKHTTSKTVYKAPGHLVEGWRAAQNIPSHGIVKDTLLTAKDAEKLRNIKDVPVYKKPAVIKPIMLGTERAALHKGNLLSNMGYRFIKGQIQDRTSLGHTANLHDYDPISAYAYGAEFGQGLNGRF